MGKPYYFLVPLLPISILFFSLFGLGFGFETIVYGPIPIILFIALLFFIRRFLKKNSAGKTVTYTTAIILAIFIFVFRFGIPITTDSDKPSYLIQFLSEFRLNKHLILPSNYGETALTILILSTGYLLLCLLIIFEKAPKVEFKRLPFFIYLSILTITLISFTFWPLVSAF